MTKMAKELQNQENNNKGILFLLNLIYYYLKWQFNNLSKSGILKILLSVIKEQSTFSEQLMRVLFPELYKQIFYSDCYVKVLINLTIPCLF